MYVVIVIFCRHWDQTTYDTCNCVNDIYRECGCKWKIEDSKFVYRLGVKLK